MVLVTLRVTCFPLAEREEYSLFTRLGSHDDDKNG